MELKDGYWADEQGNRWGEDFYTEPQAKSASETLTDCRYCTNCTDCTDCRYCTNCTNCTDCRYCTDCTDCRYCTDCRGFKQNPNRYAFKGIGGNYYNTCAYWVPSDSTEQIVCGCFRGDLKAFEKAVRKKYLDDHDYVKAIRIIRTIREMEK